MPHFEHTYNKNLEPGQELLMRVKLHIRGGKRRLREGKISLGILTLYDALNSAMQWYVTFAEHKKMLRIMASDDLNDDSNLFDVLMRSGVIERGFSYDAFNELVDTALKKDMSSYDYSDIVKNIEFVMTQLGIMPFDKNELPPDSILS